MNNLWSLWRFVSMCWNFWFEIFVPLALPPLFIHCWGLCDSVLTLLRKGLPVARSQFFLFPFFNIWEGFVPQQFWVSSYTTESQHWRDERIFLSNPATDYWENIWVPIVCSVLTKVTLCSPSLSPTPICFLKVKLNTL